MATAQDAISAVQEVQTVGDAILAELARPERLALLKQAWSAYGRSKRKEPKGWEKGKKRLVDGSPLADKIAANQLEEE